MYRDIGNQPLRFSKLRHVRVHVVGPKVMVKCYMNSECRTMKCIQVKAPGEPLEFLDKTPIPEAPETGAVVKVSYAGMCRSDVSFWKGSSVLSKTRLPPRFKFPRIPGHEISGVLYSVGANCAGSGTDLKLGDRVIVYPWLSCNSCRPCSTGYNPHCEEHGPPILIGLTLDGGYAEFVSVPELRYVLPLPASIPLPLACLLPCSGLTAYSAVETAADFVKTNTEIRGKCSVMVIGLGGLGQWGVHLARGIYPPETQIICADVKQEALDLASKNVESVTPLLLALDQPTDSTVQEVKTASGGGVNLVLDFVGSSKSFDIGRTSLKPQGRYHVVGLFGGQAQFTIPHVVLNGIVIQGLVTGSLGQLKQLIKLVVQDPSIYANLHYQVYPLEDGIQVMEKFVKGEVIGRSLLKCCSDADD